MIRSLYLLAAPARQTEIDQMYIEGQAIPVASNPVMVDQQADGN
jgi:hypothetical protein